MVTFRIRFHLANGPHKGHYQIKRDGGRVATYVNPSDAAIKCINAKLINSKATAQRIHDGENKSVCAWVQCEGYELIDAKVNTSAELQQARYNPRVAPHWVNDSGQDVDGHEYQAFYLGTRYEDLDSYVGRKAIMFTTVSTYRNYPVTVVNVRTNHRDALQVKGRDGGVCWVSPDELKFTTTKA